MKPKSWQLFDSGTPASHSSSPSTTPSPHTLDIGAQTRSLGLPPVQLPSPEQHGVLPSQPSPSPVAMQAPQSAAQLPPSSLPLHTPSPQEVPQSVGQLALSSEPLQVSSPHTAPQSSQQVTESSVPLHRPSAHTSGQSSEQVKELSPPSQLPLPQLPELTGIAGMNVRESVWQLFRRPSEPHRVQFAEQRPGTLHTHGSAKTLIEHHAALEMITSHLKVPLFA